MKTIYNCEYCGSRIFESDRNCVKCGAPIAQHEEKKEIIVKSSIKNPLMYTYHKGQNGDDLKFVEPILNDNIQKDFYRNAWNEFVENFC